MCLLKTFALLDCSLRILYDIGTLLISAIHNKTTSTYYRHIIGTYQPVKNNNNNNNNKNGFCHIILLSGVCACVRRRCRLKGDKNPTRLKINSLLSPRRCRSAAAKHLFADAARYENITNDNKNGKRSVIYRRICQTQ